MIQIRSYNVYPYDLETVDVAAPLGHRQSIVFLKIIENCILAASCQTFVLTIFKITAK